MSGIRRTIRVTGIGPGGKDHIESLAAFLTHGLHSLETHRIKVDQRDVFARCKRMHSRKVFTMGRLQNPVLIITDTDRGNENRPGSMGPGCVNEYGQVFSEGGPWLCMALRFGTFIVMGELNQQQIPGLQERLNPGQAAFFQKGACAAACHGVVQDHDARRQIIMKIHTPSGNKGFGKIVGSGG